MAAIDDSALDQLFREARSYNGYTDAPVTESDVEAIYDLLKMAPTSANTQPARFVWCLSAESRERLAACASPQNAPKIAKAPAAVVIAYDLNFPDHLPDLFPHIDARPWFADPVVRERTAVLNGSLQGAYFIMAARALGFDTGPMAGYDVAAVEAAFLADTPGHRVNFISTMGHGDPASIFGRLPRPYFETFNTIA